MTASEDCGMLIKQIHDTIAKSANAELGEKDLTLSQIRFIKYIAEHGGKKVPLKDIEAYFKVSQPTIAGITKRLELKKLISTSPDKDDMRTKNASLTARGLAVSQDCRKNQLAMEEKILRPLSRAEREAFQSSLIKICNYLESE